MQPAQKAEGAESGYQAIDSASVIATHVNKIVRSYIPDLFNYDDIHSCVTVCRRWHRAWRKLKRGAELRASCLKVYRALLTEGVSLRGVSSPLPPCWSPVAR
ncbi:FHIPEP family type III secretion protein [Escherichia coli]